MLSAITVLIFDLQGTSTDFYTPVYRKVSHYLPHINADAFVTSWRKKYFSYIKDPVNQHIPSDEIYQKSLYDLLNQYNTKIALTTEQDLINSWVELPPWPDTIPGLNRLRKKYIITTLSNAHMSSIVKISRYAGITWDAIFSAHTTGAYKPDPKTYQSVLDAFAIQPSQALMIASHTYDLHGAASIGLPTAYIYRQHEYGPCTPPPPTAENFTIYADNFLELADTLNA